MIKKSSVNNMESFMNDTTAATESYNQTWPTMTVPEEFVSPMEVPHIRTLFILAFSAVCACCVVGE